LALFLGVTTAQVTVPMKQPISRLFDQLLRGTHDEMLVEWSGIGKDPLIKLSKSQLEPFLNGTVGVVRGMCGVSCE
jgi:hypothetical protein